MSAILVAAVSLCAMSLALQASNDDCSHPPMQEVVPEKAHGYIRSVFAPAMYDYAAECKLSPLCLSFTFDPEKRTCQRLTEKRAKTDSSFTVGSGVFFSNIHDWKMVPVVTLPVTPIRGALWEGMADPCVKSMMNCSGVTIKHDNARRQCFKCRAVSYSEQCLLVILTPTEQVRHKLNKVLFSHPDMEWSYSGLSPTFNDLDIGMMCTRDDDCTVIMTSCYRGRCLCHPGYSHNITSNSCDRECKRYANAMTLYKELTILGHNRKWVRHVGGFKDAMTTCMKACFGETSYVCKTVDFRLYRGCYLSSEGYLDVSARERERHQSRWWMAVRRCQ